MNNIAALVQIMVWRRPGDKPLSEPRLVYFTDAYIHRSAWLSELLKDLREPNQLHTSLLWSGLWSFVPERTFRCFNHWASLYSDVDTSPALKTMAMKIIHRNRPPWPFARGPNIVPKESCIVVDEVISTRSNWGQKWNMSWIIVHHHQVMQFSGSYTHMVFSYWVMSPN